MRAYRHEQIDGVPVVHRSDPKNSISAWLGLTTFRGMLAAVVEESSAKEPISGLLDLVDLHLSGQGTGDGITLLIDEPHPEAVAALEVLRDSVVIDVPIHLVRYDGHDWVPLEPSGFDHADARRHYPRWPGLLDADFTVPSHVVDLVKQVGLPEMRAYPQLTAKGEWSLRVEGLQVGRASANRTGWLDVGKIGKRGATGAEREVWLEVSPSGRFSFDDSSTSAAAIMIRTFAARWRERAGGEQNEHVLESRILRGAARVPVDGRPLELISPDDGVVSWGSQFPTKWGSVRSARYLDALLRDPVDRSVPWAVEMKVRLSEGQYYRHAVAQAALYRHFIRSAEALHFWFAQYDLDAPKCRAAVVVPDFRTAKWQTRLTALCKAFDVALVTVPEAATLR